MRAAYQLQGRYNPKRYLTKKLRGGPKGVTALTDENIQFHQALQMDEVRFRYWRDDFFSVTK